MCGPRYAASPVADAERVLQQRAAGEHRRVERAATRRSAAARSRARGAARPDAPPMTRATESSHGVSMSRSCMQEQVGDVRQARAARRRCGTRSARRTGCPTSSPAAADLAHAAGDAAACTAAAGRPAGCSARPPAPARIRRAASPARSAARPTSSSRCSSARQRRPARSASARSRP